MSIKYKIIVSVIALLIFSLLGVWFHYSSDIDPYDDNHLMIHREEIPDEENGFLIFQEALDLYVTHEEIDKSQSLYISRIKASNRKTIFKNILNFNNFSEEIDEEFLKEFLAVNEKSFDKLMEALKYRKFYIGPVLLTFDKKDILEMRFKANRLGHLSDLLLMKSRYFFHRKEYSKSLMSIKKSLEFSEIIGDSSESILENVCSYALKDKIVELLVHGLKGQLYDSELAFNVIGDLENLNATEENLKLFYKLNYHMSKYFILNAEKMTYKVKKKDSSWLLLKFCFKKNMTVARLGAVTNALLESKIYDEDLFALTKNNNMIKYHKNAVGDIVLSGLLMTRGFYRELYFKCKTNVTLANSLIALMRYEKKYKKLPRRLGQLVPEFLKEIPLDTFNNKPISYSDSERSILSDDIQYITVPKLKSK